MAFCGLAHGAAMPGIRGAVEVVKKKWRSAICEANVERKERSANQIAMGPKLKIESKPEMVESTKKTLNKLNVLNELNRSSWLGG